MIGEGAIVLKRQFDGPVMGKVELAPGAVIEVAPRGRDHVAGLGEGAAAVSKAEVLRRIVGVSQVESPAEIEKQPFSSAAARGVRG